MGDFYDTLGISKNADAKAIKSAYRKVAMKYHPDKNPGDSSAEEKFKEAAEAYSILSDNQKRARYDQFGHAAFNQGGGGSGFHNMDLNDIFDHFGDIFSSSGFGSIFGSGGGHRGRSGSVRGSDLKITIALTLEEIYQTIFHLKFLDIVLHLNIATEFGMEESDYIHTLQVNYMLDCILT